MTEEVKTAETNEEQSTAVADLPEKLQAIMKSIEELTVMELATLVKALEEKFGVSAAAAVAVAAPAAGGAAGGDGAAEAEEKTSFDVVLTAAGEKKIQVIKEIRSITSLGLKEAKDLVDNAPKPVKEGATKEEAEKIKKAIEDAGGSAELK